MASYSGSHSRTPTSNLSFQCPPTPTEPKAMRNSNSGMLLRQVLTRGRHPERTGSPASPCHSTGSSTLASEVGGIKIKGAANMNRSTYNPSEGPGSSESQPSKKRRRTMTSQSNNGSGSQQQTSNQRICVLGRYQRCDFRLGDIICLPYHTPNLNPNVTIGDDHLTFTKEGPAYSKRRMFVVLFMHRNDMFCLPLYTFSGTGLMGKPASVRHEYVSMRNEGDAGFVNQGVHKEVEARCRKDLDVNTTVHLSGGIKVSAHEDISIVGRMPKESFYALLTLWQKLVEQAQDEDW